MNLAKLKWILGDVVVVLIFVLIGTRNHNTDTDASGVTGVALPFLVAVLAAWAIWRPLASPLNNSSATRIWVTTVAVGVLLRRFAWDRSTAGTFVMVTTGFLFAGFFGWRALVRKLESR